MRLVAIFFALIMCGCIGKINTPILPNFSDLNLSYLKFVNFTNFRYENYNSNEIVLNIGESAEYEGINVTVLDVKFTKDLKEFKEFNPLDRYYGIAPQGSKFMVIYVRIINKGNKTLYPTAHDFIVVDSHKNIYTYSILTHSFQNAFDLKELRKNEKIDGIIVFRVPENETNFKIAYCFESLADFRSLFNLFRNKWAIWGVR